MKKNKINKNFSINKIRLTKIKNHRDIQNALAKIARALGYEATIEYHTKNNKYIDLILKKKVTIEIEMDNEATGFYRNFVKCLEQNPNKHIHIINRKENIENKKDTEDVCNLIRQVFRQANKKVLPSGLVVSEIAKNFRISDRQSRRLLSQSNTIEKLTGRRIKLSED